MKRYFLLCLALLANLWLSAQDDTKTVYLFHLDEEIAPAASLRTAAAMEEAAEMEADIIVVHINTFGGALEDADKIRTAFLQSSIPVWAYIDNNAASAGALIAIACDSIFMHSGSSIGAASVVDQTGAVLPDKYQSYMRSMMRTTAETKGRRPDIAEAMVDPDMYVAGIVDSGKVLTFTTSEAIAHGYCEAQVESVQELLSHAKIGRYELREQRYTFLQKLIGFLASPMVSGILLMLMIGGIYFEMHSPGIGFPLLVSILCAVLYFAPLYLEGVAAHWEILLFVVGLILLIVELFVFPGFGVAGISGIVCMVLGLAFSMVGNVGFDFSQVPVGAIGESFMVVLLSLSIALPVAMWLGKKLFESSFLGGLALNDVQDTQAGFTVAEESMSSLIGCQGVAETILRPAGKVNIDGKIYDAVAQRSYIEKGDAIVVSGYENQSLIVNKA